MSFRNYSMGGLMLVAVVLLACIVFYLPVMDKPPFGSHSWSMSDYYAMALHFDLHSLNIFRPATLNLATPNGITASDFPIPAFFSGLLMRLTGQDGPFVFRFLTLLVSILGLASFYSTIELLREQNQAFSSIGKQWGSAGSAATALLLWLLPDLAYFNNGFIPSVWAFNAYLVALGGTVRYRLRGEYGSWLLAIGFYTLAALIRKPYILFLLAISIWMYFTSQPFRLWRSWGLAILIFSAWQINDIYLQNHYGSLFLRSFLPPESIGQFFFQFLAIWKKWGLVWFSLPHCIWIVWMLYQLWAGKRNKAMAFSPLTNRGPVIALAIALGYFTLMFQQFKDHDYYALDSFYPAFATILIWLGPYLNRNKAAVLGQIPLLFGAFWVASRQINHFRHDQVYATAEKTNQTYNHSRPLLDKLGVPGNAAVLVFEAYSFNQPLIGMHRKGYCLLSSKKTVQDEALARNPQYATCLDTFFVTEVVRDNPDIVTQLKMVGGNKDLLVFQPTAMPGQTLEQLLGTESEMLVDSSLAGISGEFLFTQTIQAAAGRKILFYGRANATTAGSVKATVAGFKDGKNVFYQDKNLALTAAAQPSFAAADLQIPDVPVSEIRIYLWNPDRLVITMQDFRISVVKPANTD